MHLRSWLATSVCVAVALCACAPRVEDESSCAPLRNTRATEADAGSEISANADAGSLPSPVDSSPSAVLIPSDEYVEGAAVSVHSRVRTLLVVTWTQLIATDEVWLEFRFGDGEVLHSRPRPGVLGEHRDVALGIPANTRVSLRIVSNSEGTLYASSQFEAATGELPQGLPRPEVWRHDPRRASSERWLFGSVEDSIGGSNSAYYYSTFWLYILDRKGRIVWYYADPSTNATSSFQRVARDGEYIWIEKRAYNRSLAPTVIKTTLDGEYFEELAVPGLSDCIDVTDDGSLLYDDDGDLYERPRSGEARLVWSCRAHFGQPFRCYTNTVNWYDGDDSVLLSFPYENTVVEVDRRTGSVLGQYGNRNGSYAFAPPETSPPEAWAFSFQHFPNRTPEGTLLVSSHVPGCGEDIELGPYRHGFLEFEIDRERRRLSERWRYTNGLEWPQAKGMAVRLPNGNTLANYGTGGVIREVDPEGRTVFGVKFDVPEGNDFYNKMVGHNVLLDDLYALNGGGPR